MSNIHEVPPKVTFEQFPVIDRRSYSEHLTSFLNSKAKDGYVINLNAEWGAGKTTFLHCWYNELKKDHPVVYFDAWKSDFTHDAMLALLEAFHSQLMCAITENKELLNKLLEGGKHFAKSTSWKLLAGFIKRQGGMEADDSLFSDISDDLDGLGLKPSDLTDSLKETFSSMLEQKKKVEGIHDFKETLVELSEAYLKVHRDKKIPIYVLIDELDRCRPTYAIEVIESVKHFFNTENFVFVLATDTEQLQHSIKAVYGEGFDSASYLSRFFDNTLVLEAPSLNEYIKIKLPEVTEETPTSSHVVDLISEIFNWHGMQSLREIDKVFDCIDIARSKNKCYKLLPLLLLVILKRRFPEYYKDFLSSGRPPYVFDYRGNIARDTKHLPIPTNRRVHITKKADTLISLACYLLIDRFDNLRSQERAGWIEEGVSNHEVSRLQPHLQSIVLINEEQVVAEKRDYIALIDFAGHLG